METEASPPSPMSSLRDRLRATVCCCFGYGGGGGGGGLGDTVAQWRRRVGSPGEFRYDPLSYALNFDEGAADDEDDDYEARRQPPLPTAFSTGASHRRAAAIAAV
ncbi:hypothetical protein OsJ_05641 [Oryza sativa Japonica Group]|uniref:Uncharacterized protein n=1 Tax=Oryza sativa subsp. japonica TaxID=39947 RepID=B9F3P5_ORYSJ|nr:hypothetical protein OsJ_05641 [Oryza sativa Japonica Group]